MPIFFAFSDESGKYKKERNDKFISKNPFYCRSVILLEAEDWIKLKEKFSLLKKDLLHLAPHQEVKWSYIWSLFKHFQKGEKVTKGKPYFTLRNRSLDMLIEFIRRILKLLNECRSCSIILTLTFNDRQKTQPLETKEIVKLHMAHMLNTIENEMRKIPESYCVLFLNREEPAIERNLKEAFSEIYRKGIPQRYQYVKDSLNFEYFPQSFGSQVADYCAGVFNGCCRLYPQSIDLFRHQIWPKILKRKNKALGWGITEIPGDSKNRISLKGIVDRIFETEEKDYRISLEAKLKREK